MTELIKTDEYVGLRIGYFDIECTDLLAEHGSILCASVADGFGRVKTFRRDLFIQDHLMDDKELCATLRDYLDEEFDIVVTWYGRQFDLPFLNKRLQLNGDEAYQPRLHIDGFDLVEKKEGQSRSLDNVSKRFGLQDAEVHKTEFNKRTWTLANAGDADAMNYIVDHCELDVLLLRRVFERLRPQVRKIHG